VYLVEDGWKIDWHAETLFLDTASDLGLVVRPRRCDPPPLLLPPKHAIGLYIASLTGEV